MCSLTLRNSPRQELLERVGLLPRVLPGTISTTSTRRAPRCLHAAGMLGRDQQRARMEDSRIRAAIHTGYFGLGCSLPSRSPLAAAGPWCRCPPSQAAYRNAALGGKRGKKKNPPQTERKEPECSAFVQQQVSMSAALFAASQPLASSAGQPASTPPPRSDPETPARPSAWRPRGRSHPNISPLPTCGSPRTHLPTHRRGEKRGSGRPPERAGGLPRHAAAHDIIAKTTPTMGPVSGAPPPPPLRAQRSAFPAAELIPPPLRCRPRRRPGHRGSPLASSAGDAGSGPAAQPPPLGRRAPRLTGGTRGGWAAKGGNRPAAPHRPKGAPRPRRLVPLPAASG